MRKFLELSLITGFSTLFTFCLLFITLETTEVIHKVLLNVFPNLWCDLEKMNESVEFLRPIGYFAFAVVIILILVGFISERGYLSALGSLTLFLPVFGYFAFAMFFLSGIGVLRVLWFPLIDIAPWFLNLGNIIYIPYGVSMLPFALLRMNIGDLIPLAFMALGILVFLIGVMTWLSGKSKGLEIVDFGLYKFSRHPQYFGYLLWSYGLLLSATLAGAPRGGIVSTPSLPWLISALIIIGVALQEENKMLKNQGADYVRYRHTTSFMLPLPKQLSNSIVAPIRVLLKKRWPESRKEVVFILIVYGCLLVLLSLPIVLFFPS